MGNVILGMSNMRNINLACEVLHDLVGMELYLVTTGDYTCSTWTVLVGNVRPYSHAYMIGIFVSVFVCVC